MRRTRIGLLLGFAALIGGAGFAALAWRPALPPVAPPRAFDPVQVEAGSRLARLGYCASCHTAEGGRPLAGGKPVVTPFGSIYATNITPDPETGIGRWSLAAFTRAMREGVGRDGGHLYPAFPYTHYTGMSDADVAALYAYAMTRPAVQARTPENALPFPLTVRPLLAGWKLLFFREGRFEADPARDPAWRRGAYLAEAVSHCGACHSPRNALGAEIAGRAYEGGVADGWWSPPMGRASPAPIPWDEASLTRYLREWDPQHGGAAGPMRAVVEAHAGVLEAEIQALSRYFADLYGPAEAQAAARRPVDRAPPAGDPALARGATIYAGACAACHESGGWAGGGVPYTVASLGYRSSLTGADPTNLLRVVREGIAPRDHAAGPIMPAFRDTLGAHELADLAAYLRARFSADGPWPDLRDRIRAVTDEPSGPAPASEPGAGRDAAVRNAR